MKIIIKLPFHFEPSCAITICMQYFEIHLCAFTGSNIAGSYILIQILLNSYGGSHKIQYPVATTTWGEAVRVRCSYSNRSYVPHNAVAAE